MRAAVYKHELRQLFRLALPVTAAQAGMQLMGLVDVAVLGRLGAKELAAAAIGNAIFFAFAIAGTGIVSALDPLISQAVGAGDRVRARRVLWQGVWLSLIVTAVLTAILVAVSFAVPYAGVKGELVAPATAFLLIRTAGLAPYLLFLTIRAYLQAHGVTRPMLTAMVVGNIFNFALDILFVFGAGPIPAMGVAGAALSTLICTVIEAWIAAVAVRRIAVDAPFDHRPNRAEIAQAARVGLPIGLQLSAEIGVFALVGVLAARLGTLQVAAHQLTIGLAAFTYTIALGVGAAGSVRVGLSVGAHDRIATRVAGHVAFIFGATVMALNGLAFALFPRACARLITNQEDVIRTAIPLLLVAAVFQLSDGVQAVGAGVLRGGGDTKFPLYANLFGHWGIGFPIALWLGFHLGLGVVGLWWGLCVGLTVVAALLFFRFQRLSKRGIQPIRHATG
ncbi:MAG: MATE family efflux transporter [Acidobacteria bacterium]|nr:MAG: MATE family efflux transporter [Acidobacteriota bacterium]